MRTLNGNTHFHDGVDFGTPIGTPLKAPRAGVVHTAGVVDTFNPKSPNLGVLVKMDEGNYFTMFHMSQVHVKVGQRVHKGQVVGLSGNTGMSTGPHVHFGVYTQPWRNTINPMSYVQDEPKTIIDPNQLTMNEKTQLTNFYKSKELAQASQNFAKLKDDERNAIMSWDGDNNDAPNLVFVVNRIIAERERTSELQELLSKTVVDRDPFSIEKVAVGASKNGFIYTTIGGVLSSAILALAIAFPEYKDSLNMLSATLAGAGLIGGLSNGARNISK